MVLSSGPHRSTPRDVQDLLHHAPKNVTRRYSEPELAKLRLAVEKIVQRPQCSWSPAQSKKGHTMQRIA